MIDSFPRFSKLELKHRKQLEALTSGFEPYSDFNFTSLFSWNINGSTQLSNINGNLLVKFADYVSGQPNYSILGKTRLDESLKALAKSVPKLDMVPEVVLDRIDPTEYRISEDRDNFDYIYKTVDLATMAGGKFKKKRNKISRFVTDAGNRLEVNHVRSADANTAIIRDLKGIVKRWSANNQQSQDLATESSAITRLLNHIKDFELLATVIWVNGRVSAFSINEIISDRYAICHFEKAIRSHDDIYTYLVSQAAKHLHDQGCEYINWEQDLGIVGLRESKMAYHPTRFLKKYSIDWA